MSCYTMSQVMCDCNLFLLFLSVTVGVVLTTRLQTSVESPSSVLFLKQVPVTSSSLGLDPTAAVDPRLAPGQSYRRTRTSFLPILRPASLTHFRSSFGDFEATEPIPRSVVRAALGDSERQHPSVVLSTTGPSGSVDGSAIGVEISAHLVSQAVISDRPFVQVLFHAAASPALSGGSTGGTPTSGIPLPSTSGTGPAGSDTKYCAVAHVLHGTSTDRRLLSSAPCTLTTRTVVCLATVAIPQSWWQVDTVGGANADSGGRSDSVLVYFSAGRQVNATSGCVGTPSAPRPSATGSPGNVSGNVEEQLAGDGSTAGSAEELTVDRNFIGMLTLARSQLTYDELKEDRNVLIYVPQGSFYPGSRFRVPVKLQVESALKMFVVKVRARHGVRIVGAEANNSTTSWKISLELTHKLHGATVTADKTGTDSAAVSDKVEDVFEWIFDVDEEAIGDDRGRIQIVVEYQMNSSPQSTTGRDAAAQEHGTGRDTSGHVISPPVSGPAPSTAVENRMTAHVDIQRDNTYAIIPVVKTTELVNIAMLTGKMQTHQMRVYSVSHTGRISDVTSQTTCHSGDEEALKVYESCNCVYMDGTETHGSSGVTVITKYGRHTRFTFFEVWAPQIPVEVTLSDSILSQIKGWKVPNRSSSITRKTRGVDFGLLTHPGLMLQEDTATGSGYNQQQQQRKEATDATGAGCEPRYQSASVEVYASFSVADAPHGRRHLVGRDAMLSVTDLVRSELRIADPTVAALSDGVGSDIDGSSNLVLVEGLQPGRTEIQVLSRTGRVIGTSELIVSADRVGIERLQVAVVSGLTVSSLGVASPAGSSMAAGGVELAPRVLVADVIQTSQLTRKYQDALLSVAIRFDDGITTPLHYFSPNDFNLEVQSHNVHTVIIGDRQASEPPRLIAVGPGKGQLVKVSLEPAELCQRKKSPRAMAATDVSLEIDFSRPGDVQSDAAPAVIFSDVSSVIANQPRANAASAPAGDSTGSKMTDRKSAPHLSLDVAGSGLGSVDRSNKKDDEKLSAAQHSRIGEVQVRYGGSSHLSAASQQMSGLEVAMYTLLGVFCVAVVVFSVNCAVFVARYRRRHKGLRGATGSAPGDLDLDKDDPENCAPDWVWIGRETLERNAINTGCSEALMPEADFNGNRAVGGSGSAVIVDASSGGGSSATSGYGNSTAVGGGGGGQGGLASNRSSYISTYKGAECSIQISSAPAPSASNVGLPAVADLNANVISAAADGGNGGVIRTLNRVNRGVQTLPRSAAKSAATAANNRQSVMASGGGSLTRPNRLPRPKMSDKQLSAESSLDDDEEYDYNDDDDFSSIDHHRSPQPIGRRVVGLSSRGHVEHSASHSQPRRQQQQHRQMSSRGSSIDKMTRAERLRHLEEAVASGSSDIEWDCNELGVTYDQLMTYFDNLKESTA